MILSKYPNLFSEDIDWIIKCTAQDAGEQGPDDFYGYGRLDIGNIFNSFFNPMFYKGEIETYASYSNFNTEVERVLIDTDTWSFYLPNGDVEYRHVRAYELTYYVPFYEKYNFVYGAWGRRWYYNEFLEQWEETEGWSASDRNIREGYCEVVPSSVSLTGCRIKTYCFYDIDTQQWFPYYPNSQSPHLNYAVWGIKKEGSPEFGKIQNIPQNFSVSIYPNPFNESIIIRLCNPKKLNTVIEIYDIMGKKVKTLAHNENNNQVSIFWDGTNIHGNDVKSGVYFLKINNGDYQEVKSITYLK